MKEFSWQGNIVQITKKKIKNTNFRILPENPKLIHISIPCSMTYDSAVQMLEQPRIRRWIETHQKKLSEKPFFHRSQDDIWKSEQEYQKKLQEILPAMFAKWEQILGVSCNKITVRDTRSQWGSCSIRTKNISISVWLGAFPEECIEYVVVHELTHLLERGHNVHFYGILDQVYPNWKACRERLKKE